jgi:hypothetical protein
MRVMEDSRFIDLEIFFLEGGGVRVGTVWGFKDCGKDFNDVKHMLSSIFMVQKQHTSTG